nr:putative defensin-like protein 30 [Ziziphus jujuba var. spinosa]
MVSLTKCFFLVFFGLVALLIFNSGDASAEIAPCTTLVSQGPCSAFPDCNQYCLENSGAKCGGECAPIRPGSTNTFCFCKF